MRKTNKERLEELTSQYEKQIYDLKQLLDISLSFCSTIEISKLLEAIVYICMAQLHVISTAVFMSDDTDTGDLRLETKDSVIGMGDDIECRIPADDPVIITLLGGQKPLTLDEVVEACPGSKAIEIFRAMNATLVVPLILKNHINGILVLGERLTFTNDGAYTDYETEQAMSIGSLAAAAINSSMLIERSSTDMMTRLKLKYFFFNVLTEKLESASNQKLPLSILMFDIDFFKHFNDTYGHECGDYVLTNVAALIKSNLRAEDLAGRYGGEEFVVMLYNTDKEQALAVAERIRANIENFDFLFNAQHMKVTISGGVSVFDHEKNPVVNPKRIVDQADQGLYMSKHNGRNRVTYAPPSLVSDPDEVR